MNNINQTDDQMLFVEALQDDMLSEQEPLTSYGYRKSANQITQSLLEAMQIVSHREIAQAEFNKIVKATIISCENESLGKYKVQYQDGSWYAYNENLSNQYTPGTSVYVMVPNSNMQEDKIIIGSSKQVEQTHIAIKNDLDDFVSNGYNLFSLNGNNQNSWNLWSEYTEDIVLYQNGDNNSKLKFDGQSFNSQKNNINRLLLQATIQTMLPPSRQYGGKYGIGIDIIFKNSSNESKTVQRSYILDTDNIVGDPYLLTNPTKQRLLFEIDGENFIKINKVYLFVKQFTDTPANSKTDYNIIISNISLTSGREVTEQEKEGVLLSVESSKGFIFGNESLGTDTRQIQAKMRVQLKQIKLKEQKLPFYWFVENVRVTSNSDGYCKYGGQGWYCLNQKSQKNEYLAGNYNFTVKCGDIYTLKTKYKCVVLYNGISYSKEFVITKLNSNYKIELSSSGGTEFYKDIGETTLTCTVFEKNNDTFQEVSASNFDFVWTSINKFGNFESLQSQNNYIQNLNISTIVSFTTFKCSVFQKSNAGGALMGTATILITNKSENDRDYSLVINNGSQVFKYNVNGVSPASKQNETPQIIPALTFTIYDNLGNPIEDQNLRGAEVTWIIPIKNTLLTTEISGGVPDANEETLSYTNIGKTFSYSIANNYNFNNINNNITLKVKYNGLNLITTTNFSFLKQGQNGTNGTDFVCRIVPNTTDGKIPINPTIYYNGNSTSLNWNTDGNKWFKVQLWHNGGDSPIFEGIESAYSTEEKFVTIIEWSVLKNVYGIDKTDLTNLSVSSSGGWSFGFSNTTFSSGYSSAYTTWRPANIIKVTLQYDNITYYATLPIVVCRTFSSYKAQLKDYSGFREVLYSSSGESPKFNSSSPFEIIVFDSNNIDVSNSMSYDWYYLGSVFNKNNDSWVEDAETTDQNTGDSSKKWLLLRKTINTLKNNQKYIKPADTYDGECVTVALVCRVYSGSNTYAWIHIPIHMMRNRFENTAINSWDGNSVNLGGDNGGMILAPQVGAGIKDNNNKFTGIVIGSAKDPNQANSKQTGLFGYHQGSRSIFLDADSGKAVFGETGKNQIIIDPSNDSAVIQSGDYNTTNETGMKINFSSSNNGPSINFGSGDFAVDKNGHVTAKGGGSIAGWGIGDYAISNLQNGSVVAGRTGINSVPIINGIGSKTISTKIPSSSGSSPNFNSENKAVAFWAGGENFYVTHDGYLKASQASIGNGSSPIFIGKNGDTNSCIFSGLKQSKKMGSSGFYLGVDGIAIGGLTESQTYNRDPQRDRWYHSDGSIVSDNQLIEEGEEIIPGKIVSNFQVDANGTLFATEGFLGKGTGRWNIGSGYFSSGKRYFNDTDHVGVYIGTGGISLGRMNGDLGYEIPFKVDSTGDLYAVRGQLANWTISQNSIRCATDTGYVFDRYYTSGNNVDTIGIYFGKQGLRMGANFHVDKDGNLYANNGTFTGKITATSGTFNGSVFSYGTETGYTSRYAQLSNNRLSFKNDSGTVYAYFTTNESANAANEQGSNSLLSTTGIRAENSHLLLSAYGDNRSNIALVAQNRIIIAPQNTGIIDSSYGYSVWIREGKGLTMCLVTPNKIWSDGGGASSSRYKHILHKLTTQEIQNFYSVKPVFASYKNSYLKSNKQQHLKGVFMPMLLAEDIEKVYPKAVYYNEEGQIENYYDHLVVSVHQKMLIDQHQEIQQLKQQIEILKQQIKGER